MCCCGKPVVNGELGYKWQPNDAPTIRAPYAPALMDGDELIYDEPGRCDWLLNELYSVHYEAGKKARESESYKWREAAADKRIKTRKFPARGVVKVWIEDKQAVPNASSR